MALQDIFVFDRVGIDESGRVRGTFCATGVCPRFTDRAGHFWQPPAPALFESRVEV